MPAGGRGKTGVTFNVPARKPEPTSVNARLAARPGTHAAAPHDKPRLIRWWHLAYSHPESRLDRPNVRPAAANERGETSAANRQRALSWAQRLKRVFAIEIETCRQ